MRVKVKYKIKWYDAIIFRYTYFEAVNPIVILQDNKIIVKGENGEVYAVISDMNTLIFVSAEMLNGNSGN